MLGTLRDGVYLVKHNGELVSHIPSGDEALPPGEACKALCTYENNFFGVYKDRVGAYLIKWGLLNASYEVIAPKSRSEMKNIRSFGMPQSHIYIDKKGISLVDSFKRCVVISEVDGKLNYAGVRGFYLKGGAKVNFQKGARGGIEVKGGISTIDFRPENVKSCEMNSRYIWCATRHGLFQIDRESKESKYLLLEKDMSVGALLLVENYLYAVAGKHMYKFEVPNE